MQQNRLTNQLTATATTEIQLLENINFLGLP